MTHVDSVPPAGKPWNSPFARQHPIPVLGLAGVAGLTAAAGIVWVLVALANLFPEKSMIARADDSVTNWLTSHGSTTADAVFSGISLLGGWALLGLVIVVVAALLVRRAWLQAAAMSITCLGAVILNAVFRMAFQRTRPVDATEFTSAAQSWNSPSGHAVNALVCYGIVAFLLMHAVRSPRARVLVGLVAVALVIVVGFTRLYLGVHSLSDVVTGYAAGAVWLAVCIAGFNWATNRAT
jgi:undecaprenyl-diphosphatase